VAADVIDRRWVRQDEAALGVEVDLVAALTVG
jgi:hypothetical protein